MAALDHLQLRNEAGDYRVVVETPKGSPLKFVYEPGSALFEASKRLPAGLSFPLPFGFLAGTRGDDGDPLDALVLTDLSLPTGALLSARLVGVLKSAQDGDGTSIRNDRFLVVPVWDRQAGSVQDIHAVQADLLDAVEAFFVAYHAAEGALVRPLGREGAAAAIELVRSQLVRPG